MNSTTLPTDEELQGMNQQEFLQHATKLLAEVKRLRDAIDVIFSITITPLQAEVKRLREGRLNLINEVILIINNKTGERVDADLHDYIIDRLVNE